MQMGSGILHLFALHYLLLVYYSMVQFALHGSCASDGHMFVSAHVDLQYPTLAMG